MSSAHTARRTGYATGAAPGPTPRTRTVYPRTRIHGESYRSTRAHGGDLEAEYGPVALAEGAVARADGSAGGTRESDCWLSGIEWGVVGVGWMKRVGDDTDSILQDAMEGVMGLA